MTSPGGARELPAGRLANFEGDDEIDLASLLPRRPTAEQTTPTTPAPGTPTPTTTPATTSSTGSSTGSSTEKPPPSPKQSPANTTREHPAPGRANTNGKTNASTATPPARKTAAKKTGSKKRDAHDSPDRPDTTTAPPAPFNPVTNRANLIKPSSAQIPSALIPLIARRREETGRSNGEIVLDAIEATHPDLATLLHPRGQAGGGLFAARASRGVRKVDGPLTGLNIRLYEADYDVIDQLVAQFGALSRGHLISVALTAFLHEDSTE